MSSFDAYMGSMYPGWAIASGMAPPPNLWTGQQAVANQQGLVGQQQAQAAQEAANFGHAADYAAIGAAYGRGTGGFGGRGGVAAPAPGGSVFDTGTSPVPYTSGPFMSASPSRGIGSSIPTPGYQTPFNAPPPSVFTAGSGRSYSAGGPFQTATPGNFV